MSHAWNVFTTIAGRAALSFDDLGTLLAQNGDCTVLTIPKPAA